MPTHHIWKQALLAFSDNFRKIFPVMLFLVILPQLTTEWVLARSFQAQLLDLRALWSVDQLAILDILQELSAGMMLFFGHLCLNFMLFSLAYIIITEIGARHYRSQPQKRFGEDLRAALRKLPKVFILLLILFLVYVLIQATIPPLIIFVAPIILAPTLAILGPRRIMKALGEATTLRYCNAERIPKISVYFVLLGYIGFLILALYVGIMASGLILNVDQWFTPAFHFVNGSFMGMPFSAAHLVFEIFFVSWLSFATVYFVFLKVGFYYFAHERTRRLPEEGIQV